MIQTEKTTPQAGPFTSLSALLRHALGDEVLAPGAKTLLDMMTEDVSFEFPFPMPNGIRKIAGKAALRTYLPRVGAVLSIDELVLDRTLVSADGSRAVIEFSCKGCNKTSDARYDQDYVSVIDLKDGYISRYRDYWNPLIALSALGESELANANLTMSSAT